MAAAPESSRARILFEARAEFARSGFARARLQDIAGRAGLSHPTLLYHFGSKEGLYAAVIEQAGSDWAEAASGAGSTGLSGFDPAARRGPTRPVRARPVPRRAHRDPARGARTATDPLTTTVPVQGPR